MYFNGNGQLQKQITDISVSEQGSMEWLPQETILFDDAIAELNTNIELTGNALYAGWDIVCLGRTASGERFTLGQLTQNLRLIRDNKPAYLERLQLDAGSETSRSLLGLNGCTVFGTFLITQETSPDLTAIHDALAEKSWHQVTAITWRAGVFVARYLGNSSEQARNIFTWLWEQQRELFNGRPYCRPIIWNT